MTITISKRLLLVVLLVLAVAGAAVAGYYYGRSTEDEKAAYRKGLSVGKGMFDLKQYARAEREGAGLPFGSFNFQRNNWYVVHLSDRFGRSGYLQWIDKTSDFKPGLEYSLCGSNQDDVCYREMQGG